MYSPWIILFIVFTRRTGAVDEEEALPAAHGIVLESNSSAICTDAPSTDFGNFFLCTFLRLKHVDSNRFNDIVLFELHHSSDSFELVYNHAEGHFKINYYEESHLYPKRISFDEWTKLCVQISDSRIVKFEVNYRVSRNVSTEESENMSYRDKSKNEMQFLPIIENSSEEIAQSPNVSFCAGVHSMGKYSFIGSIAGTVLEREENIKSDVKDACIFDFNDGSVFPGVNKKIYGQVKEDRYQLEEICWDTHVFLLLDDTSYFDEHFSRCNSLNGRLILKEEALAFSEKLNEIYLNKTNAPTKIDVLSNFTWLHGGMLGAITLTVRCPVFNLVEGKVLEIPCIVELDYNFCMVPKYVDFFYYGPLIKYDIYYTLQAKNNTMFLVGDEGTFLERRSDHWILHSYLHKEYVTLFNATIPVGRNKWKHFDQDEFVLTFTYCDSNQFACTSGDCIPLQSRCNGTVECLDASDEEKCILLNKKLGYLISRTPPPRKNESLFNVKYFAYIFNIADISTSDGVAVVDAYLTMTWHDPRITFNDPVPDVEIDCKEIWSPLMSMADGAFNGFQIKFESYRSSCIVLSSKFETHLVKQRSYGDPHMGHFVDGNDLPISYLFAGLITVPCRFDLRKYPFGMQTCNITFWPDNAFLTSNYKMESHHSMDFEGSEPNEMQYHGRKDLGEFYFVRATHNLEKSDRMVVLTFKLQNLFGFHMLNSFTPSILISLIAYSTLFFPVKDFNERVMVSLTALLVLAAFFTQASNTSVRTPYFKYLDVWYVVLISFCFFIVIANMIIHKLKSFDNKRQDPLRTAEDLDSYFEEEKWFLSFISKKVNKINILFEIGFAVFLLLFVVLYSLGASDII